jgi:hypothetical protein
MSTITKIRYWVRIQASDKLESIPLDVWNEAHDISDYAEHLLVTRRIIEDQIDEDLENV